MSIFKSIDAKTAKAWLDANDALLVDVREPEEYATLHIPGSQLIPLGMIAQNKLPKLGRKKLIIHCQLGKRGGMACEKLLSTEPDLEVYNLEGGIIAWQRAGFDLASSAAKCTISLDRQVRMVCGSGVLLGVVLGYLMHPLFLFVAAFFGGGLLFSGLTGSCAMAECLGKMPWNKGK